MEYTNQERDIISRTKKILEQYDTYVPTRDQSSYRDTLFINCLVGLLIIPKEKWFDSLPTEIVNRNDWGISDSDILLIKGDLKSVQQVARRIRNSISHYNFKVLGDGSGQLEKIKFEDRDGSIETFEATIKIEDMRVFVEKLTDYLVNQNN